MIYGRTLVRAGRGFRDALSPPLLPDPAFNERFSVEENCRDYLFVHRWPDGWACRKCGCPSYSWVDSKHLRCLGCRKVGSLTAGTILHRTRKPLTLWFRAAFLVGHLDVNAKTLQRQLELTYKIAWSWAHKLRRVMRNQKRTLEAPIPPLDLERALARGCNGNDFARLWFVRHGHFQWEAERPGGLGACCERLSKEDWDPPYTDEEKPRRKSHDSVPYIDFAKGHCFRAYSGSVSDRHLQAYLDETEFRLNNRGLSPLARTEKLLEGFARTAPHPYRAITGTPPERPPLWFKGPRLCDVPLRLPAQPLRAGGDALRSTPP